jgi:hypothetical protein
LLKCDCIDLYSAFKRGGFFEPTAETQKCSTADEVKPVEEIQKGRGAKQKRQLPTKWPMQEPRDCVLLGKVSVAKSSKLFASAGEGIFPPSGDNTYNTNCDNLISGVRA